MNPPKDGSDFKTIFRRMVAMGAGRPVEQGGMAPDPWTADTLADAISNLDSNRAGVDRRTVQLWLQDNDRGISPKSAHWVAMIFGCGDPEATSEWQAALMASLDLQNAKKKSNQSKVDQMVSDTRSAADSSSGTIDSKANLN